MIILPITDERKKMDDLLTEAWRALNAGDKGKRYAAFVELFGLRLIEKSDFREYHRCDWYVFRDEEWYNSEHPVVITSKLFGHVFATLEDNGYAEISDPVNDCILVYQSYGEDCNRPEHFGKYCEGKVLSKFSYGHAFEHNINQLPIVYGEIVRFFKRKTS